MKTNDVFASNFHGFPPKRPNIVKSYFPTTGKKFALIHNDFRNQSNFYDLFEDVIKETNLGSDIEFVNIVHANNSGQLNCKNVFPPKISHLTYLISNSEFVVTSDPAIKTIAEYIDKPVVFLSSNVPHSVYKNGFDAKTFYIKPKEVKKYSFSGVENPKTINKIAPDSITRAISSITGITQPSNRSTKFIGTKYGQNSLDYIPNFFDPNNQMFKIPIPKYIRMDEHFDEINLYRALSLFPATVVTNKDINIDVLTKNRNNALMVGIDLSTGGVSESFVASLEDNNIKFSLFSSNKETIEKSRLDFLDHNVTLKDVKPEYEPKDGDKFLSSKIVLSHGEIYPCTFFAKNRIKTSEVVLEKEFLDDTSFMRIFVEK